MILKADNDNQPEIVLEKVLDSKSLIKEIHLLADLNGGDYIDAVIEYSERNGLDLEAVASVIKTNPKIKFNVQESAELLNFLPKSSKLPI